MTIEMIEEGAFVQATQIKAIGVFGGGGNAIEHMIHSTVGGLEFTCAGPGAVPVIARVERELGVLTMGVVINPFEFEGKRRMDNADGDLAELEANVDSLIVVLNEKLREMLGADVNCSAKPCR